MGSTKSCWKLVADIQAANEMPPRFAVIQSASAMAQMKIRELERSGKSRDSGERQGRSR